MEAIFVELPAFERYRRDILDDEAFRLLQQILLASPHTGCLIPGTGGLRKMRISNPQRQQGKRGGIRVIYHFWVPGDQIWLFTLYEKGTQDDLTIAQRNMLRAALEREYLNRMTYDTQPLR